jgi:hypothetical protein
MTARYETDDGEISAIALFIRLVPLWCGHSGSVGALTGGSTLAICHQMFI